MSKKKILSPHVITATTATLVIATMLFGYSPAQAGSIFKTFQITKGENDACENKASGEVTATGTWELAIDLGANADDGSNQTSGFRFESVNIPAGSVIKSAYIRFFNRASHDSSGPINLSIKGEAVINSTPFSNDIIHDLSGRIKTNTKVLWSPSEWNDLWISSEEHKTVDITPIVGEIIASGWTSGNAMTFFFEDESNSGNRRAVHTYEHHTYKSEDYRMARFVIEYEAPEPTCDHTPEILTNGSYLPDFSFSGYQFSEEALTEYTASTPGITYVNVETSYGAIPNDGLDDTTAIRNAIADLYFTPGIVVLHFPSGIYNVSNIIGIERGNFVIQGEGSGDDGTIFKIDIPLSDPSVDESVDTLALRSWWNSTGWPKDDYNNPYSLYTFQGGFFYTRFSHDDSRYAKATLANVLNGNQGETTFVVDDVSKLTVGQVVNFEWENDSSDAFADYFTKGDCDTLGYDTCGSDVNFTSEPVTITAIDGVTKKVTIKEPLLHPILPSARLRTSFFIDHVGFENFKIEFPNDTAYPGHHAEKGYNGIYLADANHSWIRNVSGSDADSLIIVDFSKNVTLTDITKTGRKGHYSMYVGRSYGVLVRESDFQSPDWHGLSFNTDSKLTVYHDIEVDTGNADQHKGLNNNNLVDDTRFSHSPTNLFDNGGSGTLTAGIGNTFWNIEVGEVSYNNIVGSAKNAPGANLIGIYSPGNTISVDYEPNPYIEGLNQCVTVPSLYEYQLEQRLGKKKFPLPAILMLLLK